MESVSHVREHTHCRVCQSARLETYLDLGVQPLANAFRKPEDPTPELTAPLVLARCLDCGLSQLKHVVDRDVLYRHYLYASGHSAGWWQHCRDLADEIAALQRDAVVCDIAANDGTFLKICRNRGLSGYGVDPALDINSGSVPMIRDYWHLGLAVECRFFPGPVDVVVAQNVLGHVDDVQDFLSGIATVLKESGVAIIECPHLIPLLENGAFDTVYHEHLSYWSLSPLITAAGLAGLAVFDVKMFPDLHGGTCRYYLSHDLGLPCSENVWALREREAATLTPGAYADFGRIVKHTLGRLSRVLREHAPIYAYGASAKSTVLLNALKAADPEWCSCNITAVFDDTPGKQGMWTPGLGLPILAPFDDMSQVGALLITAENWAPQILEKVRARGFTGTVIRPWHGVTVEAACHALS